MHYVEDGTPDDINEISAPSEAVNKKYPPSEWFMEAGHPPVLAWYKVQDEALQRGLIKETYIGDCKVWFMDIKEVISIYENKIKTDPYDLWGLEKR